MRRLPLRGQDGPGDHERCDQDYEATYDDQCHHGPDYYPNRALYANRT